MKKYLILVFLMVTNLSVSAQESFPDQCIGEWQGVMKIYGQGMLKDSLSVNMSITTMNDTLGWKWKTVYHSPQGEIVKDYTLLPRESSVNEYILDEKNGILLNAYVHGNKMYSNFEVQGSYLNSVYEIKSDTLIFEIVFGKDKGLTGNDITNFSIDGLQRSVLQRIK